jgi:hypothetical protein
VRYKKCFKCGRKNASENRKRWNVAKLREYYAEYNCEFLEDVYINMRIKMRFKCHCGKESSATLDCFKISHQCGDCGKKQMVKTKSESGWNIDSIKEYYKSHGCEFLSEEYKTIKSNYPFKCVCGEIAETTGQRFIRGVRCKNCGDKRRKDTNIKKYGHEFCHQSESVRKKMFVNSFLIKEWVSPNGKVFKYQGYENEIIKKLISDGIKEDDIVTENDFGEMGVASDFWYEFENKKRRYFPDIFIKHQNKYIEVKSTYTYDLEPEKVLAKAKCVHDRGYNIEIYVLDGKKEIVRFIEF